MRRILYVSDARSIHTRRFAEHFRDAGVDVHVASFRAGAIHGVETHLLHSMGLGKLGYGLAIPQLRKLARRIQPDVVHAQYITSYGFVAAAAGLHPLVLTAWGTDVLISPRESRFLNAIARYATRRADRVTTVAEHMRSAVAALGIPYEAVSAVPLGVDTERFREIPFAREKEQSVRLICTRNFSPIYGVDTLIEAVRIVRDGGLPLKLDLVGDGPLRDRYQALVCDAGLQDAVSFHGHVPHERLPEMLSRSEVFVTPAVSDGNNVSLNEAMACGCFPIATDIPANAQWIRAPQNGLLFPPGDAASLAKAIVAAATDSELRERARKVNRRIVEESANWLTCVRKMNDVYLSAIALTRAGARSRAAA